MLRGSLTRSQSKGMQSNPVNFQFAKSIHFAAVFCSKQIATFLRESLMMSSPQPARQVLDRHYLEMRSKILDLAASLDRIASAVPDGTVGSDPRLAKINSGLQLLLQQDVSNRAEQVQMLFSDAYVPGWLKK